MATTMIATRAEVETFAAELEALWACLDQLFAGFGPDDWARRHGRRWSYADLPYHLAYFDRENAQLLAMGTDAPASARWLMNSEALVDAWNARMFAQRPAGQTPAESVAQMRASRDLVRLLLANLTDADLDALAWSPFFGWIAIRDGLTGLIGHTFNHVMEARLRIGRAEPVPPPAVVHRALGFYLGLMERFIDPAAASGRRFTATMVFAGPGGGAWTIRATDGVCRVAEERAERPDLEMTQRPETFVATFARIENPLLLMLTGRIKVKGLRGLGTFGKLFPPPSANPAREWPATTVLGERHAA